MLKVFDGVMLNSSLIGVNGFSTPEFLVLVDQSGSLLFSIRTLCVKESEEPDQRGGWCLFSSAKQVKQLI